MKKYITVPFLLVALVAMSLGVSLTRASSHREAPLITADPKSDATDLYAFVSPDQPGTVTLIANYVPFQEPAGGPNFYGFDDNVLYEINIDNDGDANQDITYRFRFTTDIQDPDTFLYNTGPITSLTDPDWNVRQMYSLTRIDEIGTSTALGSDLPVPPVNIGSKSTPDYASLQSAAVTTVGNGIRVFAGQSDDPFFGDLGGLFDLFNVRKFPGNRGSGIDGLGGFNVQSIALQVPIEQLTNNGRLPSDSSDTNAVIGVWTTASRRGAVILPSAQTSQTDDGPWIQVSRLGAPLVNELVIPLADKDAFNASHPEDDAQFADYVADPELGRIGDQNGLDVPPQGPFGTSSERDDLEAIFLTGIPNLTRPASGTPSEMLRLNLGITPPSSSNRLGVLAGDNAGYPNGRRLADDVVDISMQAVAGAVYPLFHTDFTPDTLATQLGDGVDMNDKAFRISFPYLAIPWSGFESVPHANTATGSPTASPSPSPTETTSPSPSPTATSSPTASPSPSPTATATSSPTASPSPSPSPTATSSPTASPSPTATSSPTTSPTATASPSPSPSPSPTGGQNTVTIPGTNLTVDLANPHVSRTLDRFTLFLNRLFMTIPDLLNKIASLRS